MAYDGQSEWVEPKPWIRQALRLFIKHRSDASADLGEGEELDFVWIEHWLAKRWVRAADRRALIRRADEWLAKGCPLSEALDVDGGTAGPPA